MRRVAVQKKYTGDVRNPFELERTLQHIEPTSDQEHADLLKIVEELENSPTLRGEERKALTIWKTNLLADTIKPHVKKKFTRDFWAWLLGRGRPEDVANTPWKTQPLTDDPEVRAYVDLFVDKNVDYHTALQKLSMRRPIGISECYLYYKYLVRDGKKEGTVFDVEFLKDWVEFGRQFDVARAHGQEPWNPETHPHEMAPYKEEAQKAGKVHSAEHRLPPQFRPKKGDGGGRGGGDEDYENMSMSDEEPDQEERDERGGAGGQADPNEGFEDGDDAPDEPVEEAIRKRARKLGSDTPAAREAGAREYGQAQNEKIQSLEAKIASLKSDIALQAATRTGEAITKEQDVAKVEQELQAARGRAAQAEAVAQAVREEAERGRQLMQRQHEELVGKLTSALANIKIPAPIVNIPAAPTPVVNVAPAQVVVNPTPVNVTPQPPPPSAGAAAAAIPVYSPPQIDLGEFQKSIAQASTAFNTITKDLSSFTDMVQGRLEMLRKDVSINVGNQREQLEEIAKIRQHLQDLDKKVTPGVALSGHPVATQTVVQAGDMDRLAGILQAGIGKQGDELLASWKRYMVEHDTAWSQKLAALQNPVVRVDTKDVSAAITSACQGFVNEMNTLAGCSKTIQDQVRDFHITAMGHFVSLGKANQSLADKIAKIQVPAVQNVAPQLVPQVKSAEDEAKFRQLQLALAEHQRVTAVELAAKQDQLAKLQADLEAQMADKVRNKQLSDLQVEKLRAEIVRLKSKANQTEGELNAKLRTVAAQLEEAKKANSKTAEGLEDAFYDLSAQNRELLAQLEAMRNAAADAVDRIPAPPPKTSEKGKEELGPEDVPLKTLEELRAGEENEPEPMEDITEAEAQAYAASGMEEVFHPSALEEGELLRAAEAAQITEFAESEASAPPMPEEETADNLLEEGARVQMAVTSQPMQALADMLPQIIKIGKAHLHRDEMNLLSVARSQAAAAKAANSGQGWGYTDVKPAELAAVIGKAYEEFNKELKNAQEAQTVLEPKKGRKRGTEEKTPIVSKVKKQESGKPQAVAKQMPRQEAVKQVAQNFRKAQARAQKEKIKFGTDVLERVAQTVQSAMIQSKSVPSEEQIFQMLRGEIQVE